MSNRFDVILNNLVIYLVKGLVFFLPLFFLPWTLEFFEFNKQALLWLAGILAAVLWLVKMVKFEKKIIFKRTPLDIPILTFLIFTLLSSIFSQDRLASFFGYSGAAGNAWFGLLALAIFYFLIVNLANADGRLTPLSLLKLLLYSYVLILLSAFLSVFGLWDKLLQKTNTFFSLNFNFLGGSLEMLALYSVVMMAVLPGIIFCCRRDGAKKASPVRNSSGGVISNGASIWLFRIILFFSLIFLVIVNFSLAWQGLAIVGCLFIFLELRNAGFKVGGLNKRKVLFFSLFIILAAAFLIFPARLSGMGKYLTGQDLSPEINLGFKDTASVIFPAFKENIILGSGPGTFSYIFSLYRPDSLNNTDLWQFRFDHGASSILEMLGTIGILGILSYLLILSSLFYLIFIFLKRGSGEEESGPASFLLVALLVLIFFQFSYYASTSTLFLFWLMLALLMVSWRVYPGWLVFKEIKLEGEKFFFKILEIGAFFFFSAWLVLAGFTIRYWLADFYARAGGETNLIKSARLNSYQGDYDIRLAKTYLNKIRSEALKPADFRDDELIQKSINSSVAWAKEATRISPRAVAAWETLGMVYRDIGSFTQGSEIWAAKSFNQASSLEPSNPVIITELGKAYLDAGQLDEAEQSLKKALELKNNYHEADFALAQLYGKQGKTNEALGILDQLGKIYKDERIYYEQGRLYYNQGETDKALDKFLKVIEINPVHSNALYSIGLALELKGEDKLALEYFKKVLELNPNNAEIKKKVEELEK
ncbi:MAG: tetratricopeptide repeat protein [Patescibacteria group bacterium]|nr:tetratricopeptide repeat protein [Patescibacteria group bacterium]